MKICSPLSNCSFCNGVNTIPFISSGIIFSVAWVVSLVFSSMFNKFKLLLLTSWVKFRYDLYKIYLKLSSVNLKLRLTLAWRNISMNANFIFSHSASSSGSLKPRSANFARYSSVAIRRLFGSPFVAYNIFPWIARSALLYTLSRNTLKCSPNILRSP